MTGEATLAFAGAFVLLAVSPGPGLAAILSRTLGGGLGAGLAVTAGLVVGDAIFLGIAMVGMSAIASALGPLFQIVKYTGAAYLIWIGVQALRSAAKPVEIGTASTGAFGSNIGLGLMVTLGNPKPILFYSALLPTFLDLATVSIADFAILMGIVTVVSFVVYSGYMVLVDRARRLLSSPRTMTWLNRTTGVMLVGSGIAIATRS